MNGPLRLLHLEDDPDYSDLVQSLLAQEGCHVETVLVEDRASFEAALGPEKFDVILADYLLPAYNGLEALRAARQKCPETPFLLISGTIGEQAAIESLRNGATDYVLKQWPERLVPAVRRAVEEAARITVPGGRVLVLDLRAHQEEWVRAKLGDRMLGFMSVENMDREHAFGDTDARLLSTVAASMGVALENARLFADERQQRLDLLPFDRHVAGIEHAHGIRMRLGGHETPHPRQIAGARERLDVSKQRRAIAGASGIGMPQQRFEAETVGEILPDGP